MADSAFVFPPILVCAESKTLPSSSPLTSTPLQTTSSSPQTSTSPSSPDFTLEDLPPSTLLLLDVFASNAKGNSEATRLEARTPAAASAAAAAGEGGSGSAVKYSFSAGEERRIPLSD